MKLIDADALIEKVSEQFDKIYGKYDLQDMVMNLEKSVNHTGLQAYMENHYALEFLKSYLDSAPEVPSANIHLSWTVIGSRPMDEEELEYFKDTGVDCILTEIPEDGDEVLLHDGTLDVFTNGGTDGCYWESGNDVEEGQEWVLLSDVIKAISGSSMRLNLC